MVHIKNIPHILHNGITHKSSSNANPNYVPIGDDSIINSRSDKLLTVKTTTKDKNIILGEYIPFYFGYRTPMLYVIQKGFNSVPAQAPENIVYLVCSIQSIIDTKLEFYFTDGHAIDFLSNCYDASFANSIHQIIDIKATKIIDWTQNRDDKRKKEAEFLIKDDIPIEAVVGYICYNKTSKTSLIKFGVDEKKIKISKDRYF